MDPFEELEAEHRLILRVVDVMDKETLRLGQGAEPNLELMDLLIDFFSGFADMRHHGKEERFLFPLLASKKDIVRDGPVKVLTSEHESGRYFVRELREGRAQLSTHDMEAVERVHRAYRLYSLMLRKHIAKEEEILFLLARVILSPIEINDLTQQFAAVDEALAPGSREEILDMASRMEKLAAVT